MWKFRFWLAVAGAYDKLADITLDVAHFFNERCKHAIKKYKEHRLKYAESQASKHEYLK